MKDFIKFHLDYYQKTLKEIENKKEITESDILLLKRLIKFVDDIVFEGYIALFDALEKEKIYSKMKNIVYIHKKDLLEKIKRILIRLMKKKWNCLRLFILLKISKKKSQLKALLLMK